MAARKYTSLTYKEANVAFGNYDTERLPITGIILHTTVSSLQSAITTFGTIGTKKSAHYIVGLDGSLTACLEEYNVAYQAGNYPVNQTTIGIEHEDGGNYNAKRSDALYQTSSKLVADICRFYNIPCTSVYIKRHSDIIATSCPDALDTNLIIAMANQILATPPPPKGVFVDDALFGKLVTKATSLDVIGSYLGFPQADIDRVGFSAKVIEKIKQQVQSSVSQYTVGASNSGQTVPQTAQTIQSPAEQAVPIPPPDVITWLYNLFTLKGVRK